MDFSQEWKSLWSVGSVFPAPLLLTGPSAEPLGPLLFHSVGSPTPLPSSPSSMPSPPENCPPFLPATFRDSVDALYKSIKGDFVPRSLLTDVAVADMSQSSTDGFPDRFSGDVLQTLKCRNGQTMLFFPTGENSDRIACAILSGSKSVEVGKVFQNFHDFNHRILRISTNPLDSSSSLIGTSFTQGLLLIFTLYSVNWFRVEIRGSDPFLLHFATANFRSCVSHCCWSPHLPEESAVLLDNGELHLYDLNSCYGVSKLPVRIRKEIVFRELGNLVSKEFEKGWWCCEFGWHPRVLIVACASTVFLIDLRESKKGSVSFLAKIELLKQGDRFISLGKGGFDHFYFSVATHSNLLLFDSRQPLTPILQWDHGLDHPDHVYMFKLSDLRPWKQGGFKWASDSGFAILVGSFRKCEFSLFCYGPLPSDGPRPLAGSKRKVTMLPRYSEFQNPLCAWQLPSEFSLLGSTCSCGDCIVHEEFCVDKIPYRLACDRTLHQKKDKILGFCILTEDLLLQNSPSDLVTPKNDGLGGFNLIRLLSSRRLESQMYRASWNFPSTKCGRQESQLSEDCFLSNRCQEYTFLPKFIYFKLECLKGYLKGGLDLANTLVLNTERTYIDHDKSERKLMKLSYLKAPRELIYSTLKAVGVKQIGSLPAMVDVFNSVSVPTSIHEIAYRRMWTALPLDFLQLAFVNNSDLYEEETYATLEFLDVPNFLHMQFPPFFMRKPSKRSEKLPPKSKPSNNQSLVGPVLPLPILVTAQQMCKPKTDPDFEARKDGLPAELELDVQCQEVGKVAGDLVSLRSHPTIDDQPFVSLRDDSEENWVDEPQNKPYLFSHEIRVNHECNAKNNDLVVGDPVRINQASLLSMPACNSEDNKYSIFVCAVHKPPNNEHKGLEIFDDLSPVKLCFDASSVEFVEEEMTSYKCLKSQFSKWQGGFEPYANLYKSSSIGVTQ